MPVLTRLREHPAGRFALRFWHLLVYRRVSGLGAEAAFWLVFSLPWLRIRLMSVALLVGGGLLLAILLPLLSFGPRVLSWLFGASGVILPIVGGAMTLALLLLIIVAVQYYSLTDRPSLRSLLPGAVMMVVGWDLGAVYLSYYVRRLFADTSVYGVLAAPIAVIVYALVACLVAFWGVTLNAALRGVDAGPGVVDGVAAPPPSQA
ncbi:MAG: hypothetical protein E6Q90_02245 [Actinobacteria bacterium]|nr:MAG: hypothetical protein E6Q90_02245 [Actinomycetota bacterium]